MVPLVERDLWRARLQAGEVHIWLTYPEKIQDEGLLAAYDRFMTEEERARQQRFMFARHRHDFLVTRALVRTTLSHYLNAPPASWRFVQNEHGRPELAPGQPGAGRLTFNISHTDGLIVCLVAVNCAPGVDVEHSKRVKSPLQLASHFFSPKEVQGLEALDGEAAQRARFFAYWTLKEALIKAKGMGLALPLHKFSFDLETPGLIRIGFDESLHEQASAWQFAQWQVSATHTMAAAIRHQVWEQPLSFHMFEVTPLVEGPRAIEFLSLGASEHLRPAH